jgi:hypothetical protein
MTDSLDVTQLQFAERPWSFLARANYEGSSVVVKVPKGSRDTELSAALAGAEERRLATNEWETLRALSRFNSDRLSVPVAVALLSDAPALLTEHIGGLVALTELLPNRPRVWASSVAGVGEWLAAFHSELPGFVIDGLKADNLDVAPDGSCVLFDPNELMIGGPVTDVARLCVSLLGWSHRRVLPAKQGRVAALAFLLGYGPMNLDDLRAELEPWIQRASYESRVALGRRLPRPFTLVIDPWVRWRERRVRNGARHVLARLAIPAEDPISGRYDSIGDAEVYRQQQERLSLRTLRLSILARLEVAAIMRKLRHCAPVGIVLDLPGGTGKLWPTLTNEGLGVVAGDLSASMLAAAAPSPDVTRIVMDGRAIPYGSNAFDGSISLRLLHRLPSPERVAILRELCRVSRRWLVGSVARSDGLYRFRHSLRTFFKRNRAWAPHPVSPLEVEMELAVAGLRLKRFSSVASLLSNEAVFLAEPMSSGGPTTPVELVCPACRTQLNAMRCGGCGGQYTVHADIPDVRLGSIELARN